MMSGAALHLVLLERVNDIQSALMKLDIVPALGFGVGVLQEHA